MATGRLWPVTFRERFCAVYKCDPKNFEVEVFWRCLHRHAWLPARYYYKREPEMFKEDLDFIHEIGSVRDPHIFKSEVNRYHGRNIREKAFVRGKLGIRVSAKRVINLKNKLFRPAS